VKNRLALKHGDANARTTDLHQQSAALVKRYATIVKI